MILSLGESETPPSLNRYLYAYGNPTVYIDLQGYLSVEDIQKAVMNPMGLGMGLTRLGLEYINQKLDEITEARPDLAGTPLGAGAITGVRMVTTIGIGIIDQPKQIAEQTVTYLQDPTKLENLPILGEVGKNLGVSAANFVENPNFETGLQAFGAVSQAFLTVAPFMPKGPRLWGKGMATEEAAITVEARSSQVPVAKAPLETKPSLIEKGKAAYKESRLGDETGAVGKDIGVSSAKIRYDAKLHQYRDMRTGRMVSEEKLPWPKDSGFATKVKGTVQEGTIIDRFGKTSGRTAGEPGATISERGLPPGSEARPYHKYRVIKDIKDAEIGTASAVPEFDATGGSKQYLFKESLDALENKGYLEEIK
jgi:hypothetical protein